MSAAIASAPIDGALQKQCLSVQQTADTLKITSADEYIYAAEFSKTIAGLRKEVDNTFNPIIAKAHAAHKEACDQKRKVLAPLEAQQAKVDGLLINWNNEQERIRREEEKRLQDIARKAEDDRAMLEAQELERQGDKEQAEAVITTQAAAPPPIVAIPSSVPKVAGIAKRTNWRWRVKDINLVPRQYLQINEVAVGGVVRSLKGQTNIPGIEVYSEDSAIHR